MSTLTIDDELYQRATEAAAAQGKTVDEFVGEALRQALSMCGHAPAGQIVMLTLNKLTRPIP